MDKHEFDNLDDSIYSFELIKQRSEALWKNVTHHTDVWGLQIQENSKWEHGLSQAAIDEFEAYLGVPFPPALRNYFSVMNGLTKAGINYNGNEAPLEYGPIFYAFPEDVPWIKELINWSLEANGFTRNDVVIGRVPLIFPYYGNRYLVFDQNAQVLSIHGTDIIYWGENLAKGLAKDIFQKYMDTDEKDGLKYKPVQGWGKHIS